MDSKEQFQKTKEQVKEHATEESAQLAREQKIQKEQAEKEAKRETKRIAEEPARLAREQARRITDLAREQAVIEYQEARKLKAKKRLAE